MRPDFLQKECQDKKRYYLSNLRSQCKSCNGEGMYKNEDERTYRDCPDCVGKYNKVMKYIETNISIDYLFLGMDDVKNTYTKECFDAFRNLAKKANMVMPKFGIWFSKTNDGFSYGVTTAGTIFVKIMVNLKYEAYIVSMDDLIDTFFSFSKEDKEAAVRKSQMYEYLSSVPCLMIDGFGTEQRGESQFIIDKLLTFLNSRKMNNHATLICSDLSKDNIGSKYDGIAKFLSLNFINFPIQCSNGKYQRQAVVKLDNEFPELASVTSYIKDSNKSKPIKKIQDKPQETTPKSTEPFKTSDSDITLDKIAENEMR